MSQLLFTHGNHFQFGFNNVAYNHRKSEYDKWWVAYGRSATDPLGFRKECIRAAKLVRDNTPADIPIWCLFSGGVDSEVVLRSFVEARIPVRVAITRYRNDYNLHDISYAVIICEALRVPYKFLDLDLIPYWDNEGMVNAQNTRCMAAAMLPVMWAIDQIDGLPVIGSGECYLEKQFPEDYAPQHSPLSDMVWSMTEKERIASLYRHLILRGRSGVAGFFQYTPEVMLAWLKHPMVRDVCTDKDRRYWNTLQIKNLVYYSMYPELIRRPKMTGYEKVDDHQRTVQKRLDDLYMDSNEIWLTPYKQLVSDLSPGSIEYE